MKKTILIIILSILLTISIANAQMTFSEGSWASIKEKAKSEKKHIVVDAFTTWCGPCKWMAANTFTDKGVGEFYNKNYVNYKLDMEKGEGLDFAKTYQINAYPTIVYFDPQGELVHKVVGAQDPTAFVASGTDALDPNKQVFSLKKRFDKGDKSPELMKNLIDALAAAGEESTEIANEYVKSIPKEEWATEENWAFISNNIKDDKSEVFEYIVNNQAKFVKVAPQENLKQYFDAVLGNKVNMAIQSQETKELEAINERYKKLMPAEANKYVARNNFYFYSRSEKAHEYAVKYFDTYCNNANELNSIAWSYFETIEDKVQLGKARDWAKKSINLEKNFYNTDTYANILFKLDKSPKALKEALTYAEESIKIGEEMGEDTTATKDLVESIKKLMK